MSKKKQNRPLWTCLLTVIIMMAISHLTMVAADIDSLYLCYQDADRLAKVELVNKTAQELFDQGVIDTRYQFDQSTKETQLDAAMHYLQAEHLFIQCKPDYSLNESSQAHALIKEKTSVLKGDVLRIMSKAQSMRGAYDDALNTMLTALDNDQNLGDKQLIALDLSLLAKIYLAVEESESGIPFIEKSITMARQVGRPDRLANLLGTASELYLINNEPDKAMKAIDEAYSLDSKDNRMAKAASRLVQKAAVLEYLSRYDEGRKAILEALPHLANAGDNDCLAIAFNLQASISNKEGKREEAINHYKKALEYSIKGNSPTAERTAERGLWETMRQDNPSTAMLHLERYTALTDSLMKHLIPARLQVRGITVRHIESSELSESSSRMGQLFKWGSIAMGILLILLLGALYRAWRTSSGALRLQRQTQTQRDIFFKNITQELQTPISVIMSAGQQLLDKSKTNADERQRIGSMIVNHSKKILQHVNNLIDIDKVDSSVDRPEPKYGDIVMYVRMLVDNFTELANQHFISLSFSSPKSSLTVTFVPDYLRQIVHNLVSNGIQYTPRYGKVTVELLQLEPGTMRLIVTDTGKGIPTEERNRIFEPFYQTQNGDSGVETGLELSLVNHIVKSMGGTITVDSAIGQGTAFTIDFPVQPDNQQRNEDVSATQDMADKRGLKNGDTGQRRLVFIVEDHDDVAFFTASHLRGKYHLRFAHDGNEAFNNAQGLAPDLVITNTVLPAMDGKELIRKLRGTPALNHIPIIAMTANTSEAERLSCFSAGADAVLVKPFNSSELCLLVDHLILQQQALREHYAQVSGNDNKGGEKKPLNKEENEFINHLVDIIHAQMGKQDLDMENIAAALGLSRKQLRNRVMTITGLTPVAYSLQVRLNFARHMIGNEDSPLSSIANRCGFQNLSHFSKAFKQQFGVSPMQFRKSVDDIQRLTPKL